MLDRFGFNVFTAIKQHNTLTMDKEEKNEILEETATSAAEQPIEETGAGEAPAATEPEKPKHKYADRLSKAYPDRKFESDEDYDTAMDEHLTGLESYKERGTALNKKLLSIFEAEPKIGKVVQDMINGATFREALARHISPDDLTAIEGDPDYEGWNKNRTAREEQAANRRKFEEEYASNLEMSSQAVKEFADENGMTEEAAESFLGKIDEMLAAINSGKITKETLLAMKKAFDYDNAVGEAKQTGEIAGRNQAIIASKETAPSGDGLPKIANSSEVPKSTPKKDEWIDGVAGQAKKRQVF